MKKISFFILLLFVGTVSLYAQEKMVLNASITGMPNDSTIYLFGFAGDDKDSAIVKDHSFHFDRKLKDGGDVYLIKFGKATATDWSTSLLTYLGPGEVTIKGTWPDYGQSTITGPAFVDEFKEAYKMINDPLLFSHGDEDLQAEMAEALQVGDRKKYKELQDAQYNRDLMIKTMSKKWIMQHLNSGVSAFLINVGVCGKSQPKETLDLIAQLTPAAQKNAYAKKMREQLEMTSAEYASKQPLFMFKDSLKAGKMMAPEFTCADTSGRQVSLKDFRGKYVLVDFWASWCGPCRAANPELKEMYAKFKDKNFTILGVSLDTKKDNWTKAIQQDQLPWTQVSDLLDGFQGKTAVLYRVGAIPTNYLVDPQGKIIGSFIKDAQTLEKALQEHGVTLQ